MAVQTSAAIINKEEHLYVAECPEVGTLSQSESVEEALLNLKEDAELYLEEYPFRSMI